MDMCFRRSNVDVDQGCWKLISIISVLCGILSLAAALADFSNTCFKEAGAMSDNKELGLGFLLPAASLLSDLIVLILFVLCPCPKPEDVKDCLSESRHEKLMDDTNTGHNQA